MARERRQDVGGAAREPPPAGSGVHVDRADGVASYDQRSAQDRTEVVVVERAGAMLVGPVVRHLDRVPGPDRLGRHALAELEHEPEHLRGEVPDGHDPEDVLVAVPQEHVSAVRAEERGRVADDRRQHRLEIERLGDLPGGGEETVELRRAAVLHVEEDGSGEVERDRLKAGDRDVAQRATRDRDRHPPSVPRSAGHGRPGIGGGRVGRRPGAGRDPFGAVPDGGFEASHRGGVARDALDHAVQDRAGGGRRPGHLGRAGHGAAEDIVEIDVPGGGDGPVCPGRSAGDRALDHRSNARASFRSRRIPASAE
jgi:hypothetical protein